MEVKSFFGLKSAVRKNAQTTDRLTDGRTATQIESWHYFVSHEKTDFCQKAKVTSWYVLWQNCLSKHKFVSLPTKDRKGRVGLGWVGQTNTPLCRPLNDPHLWVSLDQLMTSQLDLAVWLSGPQAWLAGPQAWLAGPQAWLDGPEGGGQTYKRTNKQRCV